MHAIGQVIVRAIRKCPFHPRQDALDVTRIDPLHQPVEGRDERLRVDLEDPVQLIRPGDRPSLHLHRPASQLRQTLSLIHGLLSLDPRSHVGDQDEEPGVLTVEDIGHVGGLGVPNPPGHVDQGALEELFLSTQGTRDEREVLRVDLGSEDLSDVDSVHLLGGPAEPLEVGGVRDHVSTVTVPVGDQRRQTIEEDVQTSRVKRRALGTVGTVSKGHGSILNLQLHRVLVPASLAMGGPAVVVLLAAHAITNPRPPRSTPDGPRLVRRRS